MHRIIILIFISIGIIAGCSGRSLDVSSYESMGVFERKEMSNDLYMKGVDLANSGDINRALDYFHKAEKVDPENISILADISLANYDLGKLKKSLEYANKILSLSEYNYFALLRRAFIYQDINDYSQSVDSYGAVLEYYPMDYTSLANMAQIEFDRKNFDRSKEYVVKFENSVKGITVDDLRENDWHTLNDMKRGVSFIRNAINRKTGR